MSVNASELETHRQPLLRYALFRLRDLTNAEDLVQETLIVALEKPESFNGSASMGTWLTGILKHKILDLQRSQQRQVLPDPNEEDLSDLDTLFDHTGHWGSDAPRRWAQPENSLEDNQFWQVFADCNQRMPTRSALVFTLREIHELDVNEISRQLDIQPSHCSVLLYRARMSLRLCLQKNWFGEQE